MLSASGLVKIYNKRKVVNGVSFEIERGEVVAILGPNGAGKTTSFYMVTGIVTPDYGKIILDNIDITSLPIYKKSELGIGYLPQEASIFRDLTVYENIFAIAEIKMKNKAKSHEKTKELLNDLSLNHISSSLGISLSGGERRRVEVARILAIEPKYILLDEPFAGVDPVAIGEVRTIISRLKSNNIGVLITDHNVRETLKIVDRAYVINQGEVICEGDKKSLLMNKKVREVYLGNDFIVD